MYAYPVILTNDDNGSVMARFPDVPEALTCGKDEANALEWAQDALLVALSGYQDERLNIPKPSKPKRGLHVVELPAMAAVKLAIYQAMLDQGITQAKLASLLYCDARQVRRLLDLDHKSTMDQLVAALEVLGLNLDIDIRPARERTQVFA